MTSLNNVFQCYYHSHSKAFPRVQLEFFMCLRLNILSSLYLSSCEGCSNSLIIFMALCWTQSSMYVSSLYTWSPEVASHHLFCKAIFQLVSPLCILVHSVIVSLCYHPVSCPIQCIHTLNGTLKF